MSDREIIRGVANQDQDKAKLRDIWENTDFYAREQFLDRLVESPETIRDNIHKWPVEWIEFLMQAAVVGLREVAIENLEQDG